MEENIKLEARDLQLCGFRIGENYYAISVFDVQEVIKPQRLTVIPLVGEEVRGLINLRGQIVTSISLRKLFGLEDDLTKSHMNIIVRAEDSLFALVVDEILDVIELEENMYENTSNVLSEEFGQYINGVFKMPDKLLIYLNLQKIIETQTAKREA